MSIDKAIIGPVVPKIVYLIFRKYCQYSFFPILNQSWHDAKQKVFNHGLTYYRLLQERW